MFPFTAVIFGAGVILLDYVNKIAPYPLIGLVSKFYRLFFQKLNFLKKPLLERHKI